MPYKFCYCCGKRFELSIKEFRDVFLMPYFCSRDCTFFWIRTHSFPAVAPDYPEGFLDRPDEAYSSKLGMFFRSQFELCFAEACSAEGIAFLYERYQFPVKSGAFYTPDFYFLVYDCFIEVKGKWGTSQKSKMKSFMQTYHSVEIGLVPWHLRHEFGHSDGAEIQ